MSVWHLDPLKSGSQKQFKVKSIILQTPLLEQFEIQLFKSYFDVNKLDGNELFSFKSMEKVTFCNISISSVRLKSWKFDSENKAEMFKTELIVFVSVVSE